MTDIKKFDLGDAVYSPAEASNIALAAIQKISQQSTRGVKLGIPDIEGYFAPMLPGQLCAVIAQTSNYKSGFLHFWMRQLAMQLMAENRFDEAIIHVSVEEPVEEQMYHHLAAEIGTDAGKLARGDIQDWKALEGAALRVAQIPIWRIGDSLARAEDLPELYLSNMVRCIRQLTSGEVTGKPVKPAALFFDYLQAFPYDPEHRTQGEDKRRLQVREDIYRLRQAANYFDCPVIVAVQAKQKLDGARGNILIPGVYDGEESSSIAQRADRIISLWMPARTHRVGEWINDGGTNFTVAENMLFIKVAKQRGGLPAGQTFECRIDFARNNISTLTKKA